MPADIRGHEVPPPTGVAPARKALLDLSLTVRDIVYVANTTARQQLVTSLNEAGLGPSPTNPLYVHRGDAATGFQLESTIDGTSWASIPRSWQGADRRYAWLTAPDAGNLAPASTPYQIGSWETEQITDGMSASSTGITVADAGVYSVHFQWTTSSTTNYTAGIEIGGTQSWAGPQVVGVGGGQSRLVFNPTLLLPAGAIIRGLCANNATHRFWRASLTVTRIG